MEGTLLSFSRCARFSRWVTASAAVALAAAGLATTTAPVLAARVQDREWWLATLHITKAWATSKGSGITVALLDTGVDPAQPDLRGSVTTGPDFTHSGRHRGGRYWGSHGTAMASLIAGHGHGQGGGQGIAGVALRATILSIRVVMERRDPRQANRALASRQPAAIAAGIRYAADHSAQIIDLPLDPGVTTPTSPGVKAAAGGSAAERAAVAYARAKGAVLVAPAGDDGGGADLASFPAAYPGVISVGAFDQKIIKARFSSRRPYVTLTAAGAGVVAAGPSGQYVTYNSTSAASAMVAGMAALIKARFPSLLPTQVTQALTYRTVFHRKEGRAHGSGFGTADAARALAFAASLPSGARSQSPQPRNSSAAPGAGPTMRSSGLSLGETLLNDVIVFFVLFLIVLLAMSLIAVIRMPPSPARVPEQNVDETTGVLPQFASAPSPWPPAEPAPGQRSYAEAAYRLWSAQSTPPQPAGGAASHLRQPVDPSRSAGPAPREETAHPPRVTGPPWGPAPKPEGEPPSWARPPSGL